MKIEQYLFEFHEARPRRRRPSDDGETLIQGCPVRLVLVIPPVLWKLFRWHLVQRSV